MGAVNGSGVGCGLGCIGVTPGTGGAVIVPLGIVSCGP